MTSRSVPPRPRAHNQSPFPPPGASLGAARRGALFQEIVRIAETLGVPAVPLELLSELALSREPLVHCAAWRLLPIEAALDALARAGRIAIEFAAGEVMIRPLVPLRRTIDRPNVHFSLAAYRRADGRNEKTTCGMIRTATERMRW